MNTHDVRVLDSATLSEGAAPEQGDAVDLLPFRTLEIVVHVEQHTDGESPTLIVEHSASNQDGTWLGFSSPVEVSLSQTGSAWFHQEAFTRWVSWRLSGSLSGEVIVTLEIIARD